MWGRSFEVRGWQMTTLQLPMMTSAGLWPLPDYSDFFLNNYSITLN